MQFKFIGVPGENHASLRMYGLDFPIGEAVEVADAGHAKRLGRHQHFEAVVSAGAAALPDSAQEPEVARPEAPKRRGRPPKA